MNTKPIEDMSAEEMADAIMTLTPKQAADVAARYCELKDASYITKSGEVLDARRYARELDACAAQLKQYIERNGPLSVEGIGTLKNQERTTSWSWDLIAMAEHDRPLFERMLQLACLTVNKKVADAQAAAGMLDGHKRWGFPGGTIALVVEKDR